MCCERLKELCFTNCDFRPERGSSLILESCGSLEKVCLDKFTGLYDSDIISLSNKSRSLKSISLEQSWVSALTDASLKALGSNCPFLENVELDFVGFTSWSPSLITIEGILALINGCPIRVLVLKYARFLNDSAMETLSLAYPCLETLEIERPHIVTDLGIGFVVNFPRLVNLKITWCCSITNDGLKLLIGSETLHHLMIKNCPRISEQGVQGAARHVCYEQVLPRRC
ncbi:hypothetical protein LUZ60_000919 [Juncus effusus]|nr:hypothetical protein LUZ60_000919 [Juncus effusus]